MNAIFGNLQALQTSGQHAKHPSTAANSPVNQIELHLLQMCGDLKDPIVGDLLNLFLEESGNQVGLMRHAFQSRHPSRIESAAHTLAGMSHAIGATRFGRVLGELETVAASWTTASATLLARVADEYHRVRCAVESILIRRQVESY